MKLSVVFQSMQAWEKLSSIAMKPSLAYKLLKYAQEIAKEYEIAEKQRVAIVREIAGVKDGEDARLKADTPEFKEYCERFEAVVAVDSILQPLDVDFEEVVSAVDERSALLTVSDLAALEPFFRSNNNDDK